MGVLGGERWGPLGRDGLLLTSGVLSLEKLSLSVVCEVMGIVCGVRGRVCGGEEGVCGVRG